MKQNTPVALFFGPSVRLWGYYREPDGLLYEYCFSTVCTIDCGIVVYITSLFGLHRVYPATSAQGWLKRPIICCVGVFFIQA